MDKIEILPMVIANGSKSNMDHEEEFSTTLCLLILKLSSNYEKEIQLNT